MAHPKTQEAGVVSVVGEYYTVGEDREPTTKCCSGHDGQGRRPPRKILNLPCSTGSPGCEQLHVGLGIWTDDHPDWVAVLQQDDLKLLDLAA